MAALIQQFQAVILPVKFKQQIAQRAQLCSTDRIAADPAAGFSVLCQAALQNQLSVVCINLVFFQPLFCRLPVENRRHHSPVRPAANQLTADARPCNRRKGIDDNAFPCTGFAGQHIQPGAETDISPLDDRDILNS